MRAAKGWRMHLLAFANELWWVAELACLLGREARAGAMVEHEFAIVTSLKEDH
jgi:hypothetical protein